MDDNKPQQDELYVNDELTAAFLDNDSLTPPAPEPAKTPPPKDSDRDWIESSRAEISGQLKIDVYETDANVIVRTQVAGVRRDNLEVSIADNTLTIKGSPKPPSNPPADDNDYMIQECYWGEFSRSLALTTAFKEDEIDAALVDGVLTITFVKIKQEAVKKININ